MRNSMEASQDLFVVLAESRRTLIFMISISLEQHPFGVISEMYGSVAICKQSTVQWFPRDNQQRESPPSPPVR